MLKSIDIFISWKRNLKRIVALLFALITVSTLTGCITYLTEIRLRGDGSGMLVQTMTLDPEQIKASVEGIAKQMGATSVEPKKDAADEAPKAPADTGPFNEEALKGKSKEIGAGVTFVSAEKIETKTAVGVRVSYAFKDINQLNIDPRPEAAMGMAGADAASKETLKFRCSRLPGGNALLTIVFPRPKPEPAKQEAAVPPPPPPDSPEARAEQMAMMRQMFKGLHLGIAIDVEGEIVKTNSPYADGSKVTLLDIDFTPLLADEEGLKMLNERMERSGGDDRKALEALKGIKGLKITTEPEISIEFSPK